MFLFFDWIDGSRMCAWNKELEIAGADYELNTNKFIIEVRRHWFCDIAMH